MARSHHNNQDIFVVGGKPVSFYLWGSSNDDGPGWALSDGQMEALIHDIKVNTVALIFLTSNVLSATALRNTAGASATVGAGPTP